MKPFSIERIRNPSPSFFYQHYVDKNRPVVIEDGATRWPAFGNWSLDYIRDHCGATEVEVEVFPPGKSHGHDGYRTETMTLRQYLDLLESDDHKQYYMADQMLPEALPALAAEVPDPTIANKAIDKRVIFIGRDTYSPNHFHADCEYLTAMVKGEKRFQLFAPKETPKLYPRSDKHLHWYSFSQVDPNRDDIAEHFPRYLEAESHEVVLKAGEVIYIPVHWWHNVWGIDTGITVVHTWKSDKRNWTFPEPGLRVARQRTMFKGVEVARQLADVVGKKQRLMSFLERHGYVDSADAFDRDD